MSEVEINPGMETSAPAAQDTDVVVTKLDQKSPLQPAPASAVKEEPTKLDGLKTGKGTVDKPADPAPAAPVVNPYQPNFKIKVNKEEKEIDDLFKSLIKDEASEKKVKEMIEKAYGLDLQKPKFEKVKQEFEEVSAKYTNLDKSLQFLSGCLNSDDMETYCQTLRITDDKILRYAQRILKRMEMDPSQRAEEDRIRNDRLRASQLDGQNQELQASLQTQQANMGLMQTEMLLSKPEYAPVAQAYDRHVGRPDAFFEEVCKQGIYTERTTGKILSPEEAVQETIKKWSPFLQGATGQPQPVAQAGAPAQPEAVKPPPPTLPNISGRGSSPIKQGPRTIADLKKLANQQT